MRHATPATSPDLTCPPAAPEGHALLRAAAIQLGDLLVPVGAPAFDSARVLPSDTYLLGHCTTAEGLSPARLFHVYRPLPPAAYPPLSYTAPAPPPPAADCADPLARAALHLAAALQALAESRALAGRRSPHEAGGAP